MAFTVTFPTARPPAALDEVGLWLADLGEPFEAEAGTLTLRALPVRVVLAEGGLRAWIEVTPRTPLSRLVDTLFALSMSAGADVRLAGEGEVTRARLWLRLADEQDRLRIGEAMAVAADRGNAAEVVQRLWAVLAELEPGHDLRWDAARNRVVELVEVGVPGGVSAEEAEFLSGDCAPGDVVVRPARGYVHLVGWRMLRETWPGLAEFS